ncbi:MAG: sugar transporter ATP-binding protein [Burkholderia sp.]|nr:sugar transporter ATP-binding protein [Burkholderia sp.]
MTELAPLLSVRGIRKRFGSNIVLKDMDLELRGGEIHALLGENGAGKSTLINLITGIFPPDAGEMRFAGQSIVGRTPYQLRQMGISAVFQEFSLVPEMTVAENLFLGREMTKGGYLSRAAMRARSEAVITDLGFALSPDQTIKTLSRAQQQMVEIAKALLADVKLLILDEPTASLTESEAEKLFELIARLKSQGVGIIYVSHRMPEIRRLSDRVTILRDGHRVGTVNTRECDDNHLIEMMVGRPIDLLFPKIRHAPDAARLQVTGLTLKNGLVSDASIKVRAGEVVGIAGLAGCGKSELLRAIFGLEKIASGSIMLNAAPVNDPTPAKLLGRHACYFTSDRVAEGLALNRPIRENITMSSLDTAKFSGNGILNRRAETREATEIAKRLQVRPLDIEAHAGRLSGGNRQKVLLARGFARDIDLFLFDEPTVGIDVGAKLEVYQLIRDITEAGAAVLMASSDLPEILHLCRRSYVMHRSRIVAELVGEDLTETRVLNHFFGDDAKQPAGEGLIL